MRDLIARLLFRQAAATSPVVNQAVSPLMAHYTNFLVEHLTQQGSVSGVCARDVDKNSYDPRRLRLATPDEVIVPQFGANSNTYIIPCDQRVNVLPGNSHNKLLYSDERYHQHRANLPDIILYPAAFRLLMESPHFDKLESWGVNLTPLFTAVLAHNITERLGSRSEARGDNLRHFQYADIKGQSYNLEKLYGHLMQYMPDGMEKVLEDLVMSRAQDAGLLVKDLVNAAPAGLDKILKNLASTGRVRLHNYGPEYVAR